MNRSVVIIGSVVASVLVGGTVVYGNQNNTVVASNNSPLVEVLVSSPITITGIASSMTASTATLHGVIDASGAETSYWFEYSSDPLLGRVLNRKTSRVVLITDADRTSVEADITKLTSSTKYYFRIVTQNSAGIVRGERMSFNTH